MEAAGFEDSGRNILRKKLGSRRLSTLSGGGVKEDEEEVLRELLKDTKLESCLSMKLSGSRRSTVTVSEKVVCRIWDYIVHSWGNIVHSFQPSLYNCHQNTAILVFACSAS